MSERTLAAEAEWRRLLACTVRVDRLLCWARRRGHTLMWDGLVKMRRALWHQMDRAADVMMGWEG